MDFLKGNQFMKNGAKINNELAEAMEQQLKNFKEKFGREMGPDDPIFLILIVMCQCPLLRRS